MLVANGLSDTYPSHLCHFIRLGVLLFKLKELFPMLSVILLAEYGYAGTSTVAMLAAEASADLYPPTFIDLSDHGQRDSNPGTYFRPHLLSSSRSTALSG
jgi:hypothetical protein